MHPNSLAENSRAARTSLQSSQSQHLDVPHSEYCENQERSVEVQQATSTERTHPRDTHRHARKQTESCRSDTPKREAQTNSEVHRSSVTAQEALASHAQNRGKPKYNHRQAECIDASTSVRIQPIVTTGEKIPAPPLYECTSLRRAELHPKVSVAAAAAIIIARSAAQNLLLALEETHDTQHPPNLLSCR